MNSTVIRIQSKRLMLILSAVALISLGIGVTAWKLTARSQAETVGAPLAGAAIGGPFRLIDQDGRLLSSDSFKGRYRLMYFGYTYFLAVRPWLRDVSVTMVMFSGDAGLRVVCHRA